jgi:hypothetical protein
MLKFKLYEEVEVMLTQTRTGNACTVGHKFF